MISKQLIDVEFTSKGIYYKATKLTNEFLKYLDSSYAMQLSSVAKWLLENFGGYNDVKLESYIKSNFDIWGGEFNNESLLRG